MPLGELLRGVDREEEREGGEREEGEREGWERGRREGGGEREEGEGEKGKREGDRGRGGRERRDKKGEREVEENRLFLAILLYPLLQFASHANSTIDCTDRSSVAALFLTLGLKPHVSNLNCFVNSMPNLETNQEATNWIPRIFRTQDSSRLQCQLCTSLNLERCCPDQ